MNDILQRLRCTVPCQDMTAKAGCHCAEARDEIMRLRAMVTPKPLDDSAPKDRELIGVERPPCEDRNYFSFIQWREDRQRWMSRIGYDWSINPAPTIWAICGASHYIDPLDFPLLPEEVFEDGEDEDEAIDPATVEAPARD